MFRRCGPIPGIRPSADAESRALCLCDRAAQPPESLDLFVFPTRPPCLLSFGGAEHRRGTSCGRKPSECLVAASTYCLRKFPPLRFNFEFQARWTNLRHT